MILKYGSKGIEVTNLQKLLIQQGLKDKSGKALKADGDFGEATEKAEETDDMPAEKPTEVSDDELKDGDNPTSKEKAV